MNGTDVEAASPALTQRRCAYCGEEFTYQRSASRPPKYCSRIWPEPPRSCQARARAQRTATKTVGLDLPLASYQQAGEQVTDAITALRNTLDGHLTALRDVEAAALGRIEQAERDAREAWERTRNAETERDQALGDKTDATRRAEVAEAAQRGAEQLAQQAEQERDALVRKAWEQVTAKEGERAAAQARAAQQADAAAEAARQRQAEYDRAEKLAAANRELAGQLTAVQAQASRQADIARADLKAAHDEFSRQRAEHGAGLARVREQAAVDSARLRAERDREQAEVQRLHDELAALRAANHRLTSELASLQATTQAARERTQAAERRYDELVAALRSRPSGVGPEPDRDQPSG